MPPKISQQCSMLLLDRFPRDFEENFGIYACKCYLVQGCCYGVQVETNLIFLPFERPLWCLCKTWPHPGKHWIGTGLAGVSMGKVSHMLGISVGHRQFARTCRSRH